MRMKRCGDANDLTSTVTIRGYERTTDLYCVCFSRLRSACYGVLRYIMEAGAKGAEVVVSGKLRGQRAKAMKFKDGYMISSGNPVREYIVSCTRHALLRQGTIGMRVKIMLDHDPKGRNGPSTPIPDTVVIHTPKDDENMAKPYVGKEMEM